MDICTDCNASHQNCLFSFSLAKVNCGLFVGNKTDKNLSFSLTAFSISLLLLFSHSVSITLHDPMDCSTPGFLVLHQMELTQTHVLWVGDAIQLFHPLRSPSPSAFNHSQHQGLFQCVSFLHQLAKGLELEHQSFQWIFTADFHLGLTSLISLLYKALSRVFSNTAVWKY